MKNILIIICCQFLCSSVIGQKQDFLRVFDNERNKIAKGRFISATDSSLILKKGTDTLVVLMQDIYSVRTKRSTGNNILIGATTGAVVSSVFFAASADPDAWIFDYTAGEGVLIGLITGLPVGAAVGGITSIFKNSKNFIIDGRPENWKIFREVMNNP